MVSTTTLSTWTLFKNASYVLAFIAASEWLGFQPFALSVFVILMIIDVITGIVRSWLCEGCKSIKSSIAISGVLSKLLLLVALFSTAIAGKAVGFDMQMLVDGSVTVLILGELYSILGNIHSARTGAKKVEFDAVAYMLSSVKKLLTKALK
jgi:phage-related holin